MVWHDVCILGAIVEMGHAAATVPRADGSSHAGGDSRASGAYRSVLWRILDNWSRVSGWGDPGLRDAKWANTHYQPLSGKSFVRESPVGKRGTHWIWTDSSRSIEVKIT